MMEYPRKFFDALSRWLTGEPCDVLLLLCFTLIACMSFFAVLVFLWLLSKHVITLEDLYHLGSLIFFGVAGWIAWNEFYVSNRAEQIVQLKELNGNLQFIWTEIAGTNLAKKFEISIGKIESSDGNQLNVASSVLSKIGETYSTENLRMHYFNNTDYLSSRAQNEIESFLTKHKDMTNRISKSLYDYLTSRVLPEHNIEQVNCLVANRIMEIWKYPVSIGVEVTHPNDFDVDRPYWEAQSLGSTNVQHFTPISCFLSQLFRECVKSEGSQPTYQQYQKALLYRLDVAIQQELKRLVRSR